MQSLPLKFMAGSANNTPFFLNYYGMHTLTQASASLPRLVPDTFVERIEETVRRAKQELLAAQNCTAQRVNAHVL